MAFKIQNPLIQTWCYQNLQVRLFDFQELYLCLRQVIDNSSSQEVVCNNLEKACAILETNKMQLTKKIEEVARSYLGCYGRKRRTTHSDHSPKSRIEIIESIEKAVNKIFVRNSFFCLLKSGIKALPGDEECSWFSDNETIRSFHEKIIKDDPAFGGGDWKKLKTPFTYAPVHVSITQNKKISLNSSAGLYYWRYLNLSKKKIKIIPVQKQDRRMLMQIFEDMKSVGLQKIQNKIHEEINLSLLSYFLIDKYRYLDSVMTGHLRELTVGTQLFEELQRLLEEMVPCSCCMKQNKIELREIFKDNKRMLASTCIDIVKNFDIDLDNFSKELDINKLLEIFNSIPDIYDLAGNRSVKDLEAEKRNKQIEAVAENLVEQIKSYLEKTLATVDYQEEFRSYKPCYFGLTPLESQKEEFFQIFQLMAEKIKAVYLNSKKGRGWLQADYETPGGKVFNPSFHTKRIFFTSIEEEQKTFLKSIRIRMQPHDDFGLLFTSNLGNRLLDKNNWVLSLYISGTSSGEPLLFEGGHACLLVEGIRHGRYFAKFAHLTATAEDQGEVKTNEENSYLKEKNLVKVVRYSRSWPRTPLQLEEMIKEIDRESEEDNQIKFSAIAHVHASISFASSFFADKENCLVWGIKKCKIAGIDLPDFKVLTDGIATPTPITYFNNLNARYKDNSFGYDARSCPEVIHFKKSESAIIPDSQTLPEYRDTYPLV